MNDRVLDLAGERLHARPTGALWWPAQRTLIVGDLHLGKAERMARLNGMMLPPYETQDTLDRMAHEVGHLDPDVIISLGDSFDDTTAAHRLPKDVVDRIRSLAAGRRWIWVTGNHDPGAHCLPGSSEALVRIGPLSLRHIALSDATGEISAHYHPKARLWVGGQSITRRCFLADSRRVIVPAFGTYTGGLRITDPAFDDLMAPDAIAVLTGRKTVALPRAAIRP